MKKIFIPIIIGLMFNVAALLPRYDDGLGLVYTVTIADPSSHLVHIQLEISNISTDTLRLARKMDDPLPNILDLTITNQNSDALPYSLDDSLSIVDLIVVETLGASAITVTYEVDLSFTEFFPGQSAWILDSSYGLVGPIFIFYQPITEAQITSVRLYFDLPVGWDAVTRHQKMDGYYQPNLNDVMIWLEGGEEFPFFLFGNMAFGNFDYYTRTVGGFEVLVACYSDDDAEEKRIAERVFATLEYASNTLGRLPKGSGQDGFVYVLHDKTHGHVHGGMHEFGQTTVMEWGGIPEWAILSHIIFHNWFYAGGVPETPLWRPFPIPQAFSEGLINYYRLQSSGETEIWDANRVNEELKNWYSDYVDYILGSKYDVPITSDLWGSFPDDIWKTGMYKKVPLVLYLLNWKIEDLTQGEKSLDDAWRLIYDQLAADSVLIGDALTPVDILEAVNYSSGHDFSRFWEAFVNGADPLPFSILDGQLIVDEVAVPDAPALSDPELVRLGLRWNQGEPDSDSDGLADYLEDLIGTDPSLADSDQDGLYDREEFGVIVDGRYGESLLNSPLITDPLGDSLSTAGGTDLKNVYASIFNDENRESELYLKFSTWDDQYNPDAWYEIILKYGDHSYEYRLDQYGSNLWHAETGEPEETIPSHLYQAQFDELLEVMLPLDLLAPINNPTSLVAVTRYGDDPNPEHGLLTVDETETTSVPNEPGIFITDPLNPDTDGDGVNDNTEIRNGSDPTDKNDTICLIMFPVLSRDH